MAIISKYNLGRVHQVIINSFERDRKKRILKDIEKIEAGGLHGQLPVIWDKAKGSIVWDIFGNKYIDFTSTIFVANCGHGAVRKAISEQNNKLIHSYTFPTETKWKFLRDFKRFLPSWCDRIFLASAGSEVTSWAVKLMREYTKKSIIVHIDGAFHGKTGVAGDLAEQEIKISFPERAEQFDDDIKTLEVYSSQIGGLMIESYQGWSASFMNRDYIQKLVNWAKSKNIPVCFDEVQGGFWRAGKKFAYEWYEVEPDLMCLGKGLGNGVPISALVGREHFFNVPGLSSTHSGNPLCCAAAKEALRIYSRFSEANLKSRHDRFNNKLREISTNYDTVIESYNAFGLLGALIFKSTELADKVCNICLSEGLLVVRTGRESVKLGPPLTITELELIKGLSIIESAVHQVSNNG